MAKEDIKNVEPINDADAELKALELEAKRLEVENKRLEAKFQAANLVDMEERLAERELRRDQLRQRFKTNGASLAQTEEVDRKAQARCNHRKGGQGAHGVISGQGDDNQYAVIKHTFANGDMWVRCQRCGRTWKPPVRKNFLSDAAYELARMEYKMAVEFPTRNVPSGSVTFGFSDGGEFYREMTANSNLR